MAKDTRRLTMILVMFAIAAVLAWGFYVFMVPTSTADAPSVASQGGELPDPVDLSIESDEASDVVPTREAVATTTKQDAPAPEPDSRQVNLLLLDAATREPVVDAVVYFTKPDFSWRSIDFVERERMTRLRERDLESFLQRFGQRTESDTAGLCLIPADRSHVEVVGRKESLFGSTEIDYDQGAERVLLLYPDASLEVTVIGQAGRPVSGIEVLAYPHADSPMQDRQLLGRTDEVGILKVLHVHALAADLSSALIAFAASPAGGESARIAVDPLALPTEGVKITLPPTGTWTIQITDAAGLTLASDQLRAPLLWLSRPGQRTPSWYRILDTDCTCRFEHVLLDAQFDLRIFREPSESNFPGPTQSEPNLVTELRLPEETLFLHGRALDQEGKILADDMMQSIIHQEGQWIGSPMIRTENRGRFTAIILDHDAAKALRIELRLWPDNDLDVELKHDLRLPVGRKPGHYDIGDLRFDAGRLLARGRAELVGGGIPRPFGLAIAAHIDGQREYIVGVTTWPEPGVFEVRGITLGEQLSIQSGVIQYQSASVVEFTAGATNLLLFVTERGELTASFIVNEDTPWHLYSYFLSPRFEPVGRHFSQSSRLEKEGDRVFTNWRMLEPGTYDLVVRAPGLPDPLVQIGGLEVTGGAIEDPRLNGIDLRSQMQIVHVTLTDREGQLITVRGAGLILAGHEKSAAASFLPANEGIVEVAVMGEIEARAVATGFLPKMLRVSDEPLRVALDASSKMSVKVTFPAPLPEGASARLRIEPEGSNPLHGATTSGYGNDPRFAVGGFRSLGQHFQPPGKASAVLDAEGKAAFSMASPGDYRATLVLVVVGEEMVELAADTLPILRWGGSGTEVISLEVPLAPFRAAIEELGRKQ